MAGEQHERFEAMAVGHVLGGLPATDADRFRMHLRGCPSCRERVAELRGIAADLAAAERDERSRSLVRTELPQRVEADDDALELVLDRPRFRAGHVGLVAVLVAAVVGLLGFWNLHLRTVAASTGAVAAQQQTVLAVLTGGVPLAAEAADGLTAVAATDGELVAVSLAGLTGLEADEVLVGWLTGGELPAPRAVLLVRSEQVGAGPIAASRAIDGAAEFVLTRERGQPGDTPGDDRLLSVALATARAAPDP
jgi:hypothetical protein